MKILVAEDDPVASEGLCSVLQAMGHEVRVFNNGMEAWNAFDAEPTRVIISDWDMPGLSGPEFCQKVRLRRNTEYVYFILVTAVHTDEANCNNAIRADVDDFLAKPISRGSIWRRLHVARRILNFATEMNRLQLLLPICSYCKKVREDGDYWRQIDDYIKAHTGTTFSHGVCPDCERMMMEGVCERTGDEIG